MCTVVVRWSAAAPVSVLALRDELTTRPFDDPGAWWPDAPGVVGGRDRVAGGSWCVTDVPTGVTALVLNRPERRVAAPGAPSRGVLPLLAVRHGEEWAEHVDLTGAASFSLVLAGPAALVVWDSDGVALRRREPGEGTHMITSGGAEDGKAERHLAAFRAADPAAWPGLVQGGVPADDAAALLVRHARDDGRVFATVFAQQLEAVPGRLRLRSSRHPSSAPWPETLFET